MAGIKAALSINENENLGLEFYPPVRCSCRKEITHLWPKFLEKLEQGFDLRELLDEHQLRPCCRGALTAPEVINGIGKFYDIDVIEGKAPITMKPFVSEEIISYLRAAWNVLATSERDPSQHDIAVMNEFLTKRPSKSSELYEFWGLHQDRYFTKWENRRNITREEFNTLRQHTSLDPSLFAEIFNYLADEDRRGGLLRNMRLLRGVPPLPPQKQSRQDEIRVAPHLISMSNRNAMPFQSLPSSSASTSSAPQSFTISNVAGGKVLDSNGSEIPFSSLPTVTPEFDDITELPENTENDYQEPPTDQLASPRLLKDVIRGKNSIKTPVGRAISTSILPPTKIEPGLIDKQGRDVKTIREDPVTGVTLLPGVVVVRYVRVMDEDPTNPNKGIVPILSRALKANY